jgi:translation initiation factor 4E
MGGRWQIRFNKVQPQVSNKLWEDLLLGVVGEQFTYPEEINGIVISIRNNQDTMSIWNKSGRDQEIINAIKSDIVRILGIPDSAQMFYEQFNMTEEEK